MADITPHLLNVAWDGGWIVSVTCPHEDRGIDRPCAVWDDGDGSKRVNECTFQQYVEICYMEEWMLERIEFPPVAITEGGSGEDWHAILAGPTWDAMSELGDLVAWMDAYLDAGVPDLYRDQPLAQDWARVAKAGEEAGEAIDALIAITGQNPRKGHYGSRADLLAELADVALTGLYAMQHFVKNRHETIGLLMDRARYHRTRVESFGGDEG